MLVDVRFVWSAGRAILLLCTAIGRWAENKHWVNLTDCHAVQHWRFPLRRLGGELGIPGAVPRRGTDSQTIRLFQREESSWEVNQSHRHGWDWRRGCRNNPRAWLQPYPQRAPKLGVLVASRLSRRNKKDGFVNVLFCGEEEGGWGVWL